MPVFVQTGIQGECGGWFDFAFNVLADFAAFVEDVDAAFKLADEVGVARRHGADDRPRLVEDEIPGVREVVFDSGGGARVGLPLFFFWRERLPVRFLDDSHVEALAPGFVGVELLSVEGGGDSREGVAGGDGDGGEVPCQPLERVVVFSGVVGASAVNQKAFRTQRGPDVREYPFLAFFAHAKIVFAPFPDGFLVFAEHTLARAGRVDEDDVERSGERREPGRVAACDHNVVLPPFDDVFFQDGGPGFDDLVGDKQGVTRKQGGEQRGFSSGRGAQVEHPQGAGVLELPEHGGQEHGRGFLHVVGPAVETRVERECRAIFQIVGVGTPWDLSVVFVGGEKLSGLVRVGADACGGRGLQCGKEFRKFRAQQCPHPLCERCR